MKNYYDELEVSKIASKEVIEKVYKVLAKKYHPDTTQEIDKQAAEEKFKAISEAYEILSDNEKRKKYDSDLEHSNPTISYEDYMNIVKQRDSLNNSLNNLKNEFNQLKNSSNNTFNYTQPQYNQIKHNFSNNSYNNVNNYQNQNYNYNTSNNSQKKTYYYTNTGKPASAYTYYKYKIKQFFSNIGLLLLAIIAIILLINALLGSSLLNLFIN